MVCARWRQSASLPGSERARLVGGPRATDDVSVVAGRPLVRSCEWWQLRNNCAPACDEVVRWDGGTCTGCYSRATGEGATPLTEQRPSSRSGAEPARQRKLVWRPMLPAPSVGEVAARLTGGFAAPLMSGIAAAAASRIATLSIIGVVASSASEGAAPAVSGLAARAETQLHP